ncbi:MAG: GNAT family N-acetyltransferase [Propionibacteriaceae bacterium]
MTSSSEPEVLRTLRLDLVPLSAQIIDRRLESDNFVLPLKMAGTVQEVRFGPQWPGAAVAIFPMLRSLVGRGDAVVGTFVIVERETCEAVGQIGVKGAVVECGDMEIGYGLNSSAEGRGFATEAVGAVAQWLLGTRPHARLTAETAQTNIASGRVLEKCGFTKTGSAFSEEDGLLHLWVLNQVAAVCS